MSRSIQGQRLPVKNQWLVAATRSHPKERPAARHERSFDDWPGSECSEASCESSACECHRWKLFSSDTSHTRCRNRVAVLAKARMQRSLWTRRKPSPIRQHDEDNISKRISSQGSDPLAGGRGAPAQPRRPVSLQRRGTGTFISGLLDRSVILRSPGCCRASWRLSKPVVNRIEAN
jgi:hypothetical protein